MKEQLLQTIRFLSPYLFSKKSSRYRTFFSLLILAASSLFTVYLPYTAKQIVDGLSLGIGLQSLLFLVALYCLFFTSQKVIPYLFHVIFFPVVNDAIREIHKKVVRQILHLPPDYEKEYMTGEVVSATKRISTSLRLFLKYALIDVAPTLLTFGAATIAVYSFVSKSLGLFLFAILAGYLLLSFFWIRKMLQRRSFAWLQTDKSTKTMTEFFSYRKQIQMGSFTKNAVDRLDKKLNLEAAAWLGSEQTQNWMHIALFLYLGIGMGTLLIFTTLWTAEGALTVGEWVMMKGYLIALFQPLHSLTLQIRQMASAAVDLQKVQEILSCPLPNSQETLTSLDTLDASQPIQLKNLTFFYAKSPVFSGLSLEIPTGCITAITGPVGSGKSTLTSLISGNLRPKSGSISLFGVDPSELSDEHRKKLIAYLPQDPVLLSTTLYGNLTFGISKVDPVKFDLAMKITGLDTLISPLRKGIFTEIGEWGYLFSGGQRQLIALTRAMIADPSLIILDEATNHLNHTFEQALWEKLKIWWEDKTVLMITHNEKLLDFSDYHIGFAEDQIETPYAL